MLNFSTFTEKDLPVLYPIELACHQFPWSQKNFASCIGGRYINVMVKHGKQVVGFYVADTVADEATLLDVCVLPTHQGNGIGKALLLDFIERAKKKGAAKCWLEVRAKNIKAQMLYINAGFNKTGVRTGYYPAISGYEDAIVMCLKL